MPSSFYSPLLEEQCCESCGLHQCKTRTQMSDHLYRTAPEVSRVSDIYSSSNSSQAPSVCVSLNRFCDETLSEFHSKRPDTAGRISGLSFSFHHRHHRELQFYGDWAFSGKAAQPLWVLCWSWGRVFYWMFFYTMDICTPDCCPSTGSGSSYRSCVHKECWLDQWTHPDTLNTEAPQPEDHWRMTYLKTRGIMKTYHLQFMSTHLRSYIKNIITCTVK